MKTRKFKAVSSAVLALALACGAALKPAQAVTVNEPSGINLGGTSFFDALGKYTPGLIYQQYFQIQHFNAINDTNGNAIPVFKNTSITAIVSLNQFIYVSPYHLFGGVLGAMAIVPLVDLNASFAHDSPVRLVANRGMGVGDITWGPFIAFPPVIRGGRPVFAQRMEFDVISPSGSYDTSKDINPSSGFWSINPYWSVTVLPTAKTELSARFNYLHNFTNSQPASSAPLPAGTTTQAGDAGWVNFTASYEVLPKLNVGLNGYYFKQFTDDQVNGVTQKGTETESLSMGPGATYMFNQNNIGFLNVYLPVVKKNTTNGFNVILRYIHAF
ncbi:MULTISPECIES: transporter [Acidocella]|uniref:SphA family protein n=2 Tax=Acidocellaceae TaxID=3385905 RepID=UPI00028E5C3B|nr:MULTISPECIES: transporter [Acidocella]EKN00396.1 secreted protein [Acidocella sp. MX-AZ02]